jgi:delta1-piperideine-2-carboxylate reductase
MEHLTIDEATALAEGSLRAVGLTPAEAATTAAHLIDCELRGLSYGGLARCLSVAERLVATGTPPEEIRTVRDSPVSATLDGGDRVGYVVADRATTLVIEKARATGIGLVAARNTWYTGMLSWYLETITAAGLVGFAAGNAGQTVAPFGATEGRLGTNPIGFGFPSSDEPVIWDSGTSAITYAEVLLAARLGRDLPPGVAFGPDGAPTVSPADALAGAFAVWGGHRGSGLSLSVHLLGMLTGSPAVPSGGTVGDLGFLVLAIDPALVDDADDYRRRVAEHATRIRTARPVDPARPVQVPFDGSRARRAVARERGVVDVEPAVVDALRAIAAKEGVLR